VSLETPGGVGSQPLVALVLVSHSRALAEGTAELAGQMAPGVLIVASGGTPDGLGTSFDVVAGAIGEATAGGRSAVVLTDLGSAVLTTEAVLDLADDDVAARVLLAKAPFVEGAVAAAVAASGGAGLADVRAAAAHAGEAFRASTPAGVGRPVNGAIVRSAVLRNRLGLHARPAAKLARLASGFDALVTVNGVSASSVLELMKLGVVGGQQVELAAAGPEAAAAIAAVVAAVDGGFDEA
jgi:PTS hybrid protein